MAGIGIAAGLIATLFWGIADFLQSIPIRKIGYLRTMLIANALSLIPPVLVFLYMAIVQDGIAQISVQTALLLVVSGIVDLAAVGNFLRSFELGDVSIVAPLSSTYSLVTVILAIILLGERPGLLKVAASVIIVIGIILTSADIRRIRHIHASRGVKESLIAMLMWGVYFFMIGILSERMDYISLFVYTGVINSVFMIAYPLIRGARIDRSAFSAKGIKLAFGVNLVLYSLAWIVFNYGTTHDLVSIVAPVSSLYPAITVILAVLFYKERVVLSQVIGILAILLGVFMIGL